MTQDPRVDPWQIDESDFYEIDSTREQLEFLIRYAVLAPSVLNTQPWSFRVVRDAVEVHADFSRHLEASDPRHRALLMSVGATITNLRVAAAHFGFEATTSYSSDSSLVATISLRETCAGDLPLKKLFPAIVARRTNRQPFMRAEIEPAALETLCDFVDENAETIRLVTPHDRAHVEELIAAGDCELSSREAFREELAKWIRPNESSATDGICGDGLGIPGPIASLAPWMVRQFGMSAVHGRHDRELAHDAAGLLVVTACDDRISLVRAGETLEQLLLLLTNLSIAYSFMNQPVQVAKLHRELWSMLRSPAPPQLMLRFGYAPKVRRAMPRGFPVHPER